MPPNQDMNTPEPNPEQIAQQFVDSLLQDASEELKIDKATLARIGAELSAIALDFARKGKSMTESDSRYAREATDTAITTSVVRKLGKTDRAQTGLLQFGMALLVSMAAPEVDLAALAH